MDTTDVKTDVYPAAQPAEYRWETHIFKPIPSPLFLEAIKPRFPLRDLDTPLHPPGILLNAVYASAVLHHFGTQALKDRITKSWKEHYYPDGVMDVMHANQKAINDERAAAEEKIRVQRQGRDERATRYGSRHVPGTAKSSDMKVAGQNGLNGWVQAGRLNQAEPAELEVAAELGLGLDITQTRIYFLSNLG